MKKQTLKNHKYQQTHLEMSKKQNHTYKSYELLQSSSLTCKKIRRLPLWPDWRLEMFTNQNIFSPASLSQNLKCFPLKFATLGNLYYCSVCVCVYKTHTCAHTWGGANVLIISGKLVYESLIFKKKNGERTHF